jgi:hypothetical protein
MSEHVPGTRGGPAHRLLKRSIPRSDTVRTAIDDSESMLKMRDALGSNAGQEILLVIVEEARKCRAEVFSRGLNPEKRLYAIERVALYRSLVETIFQKADIVIPKLLEEVLN